MKIFDGFRESLKGEHDNGIEEMFRILASKAYLDRLAPNIIENKQDVNKNQLLPLLEDYTKALDIMRLLESNKDDPSTRKFIQTLNRQREFFIR